MSLPDPAERVSRAMEQVGKGPQFSGFCERFVRGCFGFGPRYLTANLAWQATRARHTTDMSPPPGVPVFWDILGGVNVKNDHIAISTGGGFCISTSVGPGRTVGKVGIRELTQRWGMTYRGWSEDYHGVRVHAAAQEEQEVREEPHIGTPRTGRWPGRDLQVAGTHTAESLRAWRLLMASIDFDDEDLDLAMQRWLTLRGFYEGLLDGDFVEKSVKALQTFLQAKELYPFDIDGDRGRDTVRGEIRYLNQQRRFF